MHKIVVASMHKNAGKTSVIIGLSKALEQSCAYLKPLGDRLLYRKKRLWDYDSELLTQLLFIDERPEEISLGFEHAKLRYMYDEAAIQAKLREKAAATGADKSVLFVEAGNSMHYGASVHLDAISLARTLQAKLILVAGGNEDEVLDDIVFVKEYFGSGDVDFAGVIINKVQDLDDFRRSARKDIEKSGTKVLGMIPFAEELTGMTVRFLVDRLFAKVIAGENGLDQIVRHVLIGAMSVTAVMQHPTFNKPERLIITSGDRSDMILAGLDSGASCLVLTNNILPPANIIARAEAANVPLLLVSWDTFRTAQEVDLVEPLMTKTDAAKVELLARLVKEHVDLKGVVA